MNSIRPTPGIVASAALFALSGCTTEPSSGPDALVSQVNPSSVLYTVYPARTLVSSAAIVAGELRTQRFDDVGPNAHNTGLEPLWPSPDVARFEWKANRIGLLTTLGVLHVRDRVSDWAALASGVAAFQLEGNRIAALHSDGVLRIKDGIHGPWTAVASGVTAFQLELNRVAALHDDRVLRVTDGINLDWTAVATDVTQFQLEAFRIGIVQSVRDDDENGDEDEARSARGTLLIGDGISGVWTAVATKVSEFQLQRNRIAVLRKTKSHQDDYDHDDADQDDDRRPESLTLEVTDDIGGPWTRVASDVIAFQWGGDQIGVLQKKGIVRVRDGIHGTWTEVARDALAFQFQRSATGVLAIGVLSLDGLRIKDGIAGEWRALRGTFAGATQFRLLVDVPLAFRSTPATYQVQAAKCDAEYAEGKDGLNDAYKCYPEYSFGAIVGQYGRFCGRLVPSDANWIWAHNQGPIDPIDAICREHDHADWYGIDPRHDVKYHACVVRYGIEHDRLTVDGVEASEGTAAWDAAWALMPRTLDARTAWHQESSGREACNDERLAEFTRATASRL